MRHFGFLGWGFIFLVLGVRDVSRRRGPNERGNEQEHLESYSLKDKKRVIAKVKELVQEGMSQRKIAKKLGISVGGSVF